MPAFRKLLSTLFVSTLALGACDGGVSETTSLTIKLKDAPGDFHAAVVTISEVNLAGSGGVVLREDPVTVDLLTLANTTMDLVADAVVPSGSYSQLRFVITGGYIEVENEDGTTSIFASSPDYEGLPEGAVVAGELQMPSFGQSGLKVNLADGSLDLEGDEKILLVDFDVEQSFGHDAGGSGQWVMHPVISGGEIGVTGGIGVTAQLATGVTFDLATASASLTDESDVAAGTPVLLTDADTDGVFEASFDFLAPGSYKVHLTPAAGALTTDPVSPQTVTIGSSDTETVAFTITAVN
ncbi:MAG TPA: DUF4382 domain-containing protein [Gemmatimonadales bacterium]|nr:DUF4382 domain-containing protein [Gemmatimonadales bacterium]